MEARGRTRLIPFNDEDEVQCEQCDAIYMVVFRRTAVVDRVEYCPFCGDEVEPHDDHEI